MVIACWLRSLGLFWHLRLLDDARRYLFPPVIDADGDPFKCKSVLLAAFELPLFLDRCYRHTVTARHFDLCVCCGPEKTVASGAAGLVFP